MTLLLIGGALLSTFSLIVLGILIRGLWNAQRAVGVYGINEPIRLPLKARAVVWGWSVAFIVGLAMIVAYYY